MPDVVNDEPEESDGEQRPAPDRSEEKAGEERRNRNPENGERGSNQEVAHTRSDRTRSHTAAALARLRNTAALPRSLARFASRWFSRDMRSTAASTAELSSSTMSTSNTLAIIKALSAPPTGMKKAAGTSRAASKTSWRK